MAETNGTDLQTMAKERWKAKPTLTDEQLGKEFKRSARWGRLCIAAAKKERAAATNGNGSHPETNGSRPAAIRKPPEIRGSLLAATVIAVAAVAVVTTITSYTHMHDLARMADQAWLSYILPAAVDGLVVAGSTSLIVDRRSGAVGHPLAWLAVAIGLTSSMAANVVAVDPTLVDLRVVKWVMAGYAPIALAIAGHLLLRMLNDQ